MEGTAVGLRHMGLVVKDLERAMKFYCGVLGLTVFRRETEEGAFTDEFLAIKNVRVESIKLKVPGEETLVELLQYHSHPDGDPAKPAETIPSNRLASAHISFTVKDIEGLYRRIVEEGYVCNSKPLIPLHGTVKALYCHDADGISVELIEKITT